MRGGVGVRPVEIAEHHVFAGADAPGDRLTDRSCADDDDHFAHDLLMTSRMVTRCASGPMTLPTMRGP